ncbi:MAG TPA: alpha-amylase family glycosyl hydrolase [Chitinophagaceae bacterium]|nr:alpha-amylase family glycosyl hydrolase [Chitinophagaceae bacterium]
MRSLVIFSLCLILTNCKLMKKKEQKQKGIATKKIDMSQKFKPVDWAHNTNIYEVNIRQYTPEGTFSAFLRELPRLKEMGVQTLWFMPITPISQKNKKGTLGSYYACSDYTTINPEFGTLDDFKNLVKQAHKEGLKVIIDWVANHTGWDNVWTVKHPDYYLKDVQTNNFKTPAGMEDIIELDYSNPGLRKDMIAAMQFWVNEADIDGFRCDLASWVELDFWKEARAKIDDNKPLFWLGEFDELENPEYGEVFDVSYTWAWMHKTEEFYNQKQPLDSLLHLLKKYDDLGDSTIRTWFTSNHDENSWNGSEYEKYGDTAKALAAFSCTWNGIPLIYSGQELPNKKRLKFFDKDNIEWTGTYELASFYKTLLNLHSQNPALRAGDSSTHTFILKTTEPGRVLAYLRRNGSNEVLVVINMSGQADLHFEIIDDNVKGVYKNVFSGAPNDFTSERSFEMQGWEYLIYQK